MAIVLVCPKNIHISPLSYVHNILISIHFYVSASFFGHVQRKWIITLSPEQNGPYSVDGTFKLIFLNENCHNST